MVEATTQSSSRAVDYAEIEPLIKYCNLGHLFEVQKWIAEGRPVNPPPLPARKQRARSPLEVAIDKGFHSLVQVLLEGGAIQEPAGFESPMHRALRLRRFDIVQLLGARGFDLKAVDMKEVFDSWDPKIM